MKLGKIVLYTALAGGVALAGDTCNATRQFRDNIGARVDGVLSGTPRDSASIASLLREAPDSVVYGALFARVSELDPERRISFADRALRNTIADTTVDTRFGSATYKQLVQLYFNLESGLQDRINAPRPTTTPYNMLPTTALK